ncbi:MAG: translocation/assembly module TamB domain-containing protein [Cyclobacteriaceae bacterium]
MERVQLKKIGGLVGKVVLFLILLFVILLVLIQLPFVQTKLVGFTSSYLSKKLDHTITVEKVDLSWNGNLLLQGVLVEDFKRNPMIQCQELEANVHWSKLAVAGNITIERADLRKPDVRLLTYEDGYNITRFTQAIKSLSKTDSIKKRKSASFKIEEIGLSGGQFTMKSFTYDSASAFPFDAKNLRLVDINGDLSSFLIRKDTIALQATDLSARDVTSGLTVHNLTTGFLSSKKELSFEKLKAEVGKSIIQERETFSFKFRSYADFKNFTKRVKIKAHLAPSKINTKDLALFAPFFKEYNDVITLSGKISGRVNRFKYRELDISFGKRSRIKGKLAMDGLPTIQEAFIEADCEDSFIDVADLVPYLPGKVYQEVEKFEQVKFDANFFGFISDFVANGTFNTALGYIESDLKFKPNENQKTFYDGDLKTRKFDLGKFLERDYLGQLTFSGNVKGSGLKVENASLVTEAKCDLFELNGYGYHNIEANASLKGGYASGSLIVNDSNLVGEVVGVFDIREEEEVIDVQTIIKKAHLNTINLTSDAALLSGEMDIDIKGKNIIKKKNVDDFSGKAIIKKGKFFYKRRTFDLDESVIEAKENGATNKEITLDSKYLHAFIKGDYQLSTLPLAIQDLYDEYMLSIQNNSDSIANYYANKEKRAKHFPHYVDFSLVLKQPNPILHISMPEVKISKGAYVNGTFSSGEKMSLNAEMKATTITYFKKLFVANSLTFSANKQALSKTLSSTFSFDSKEQNFGGFLTETLGVKGLWKDNVIDFEAVAVQQESTNHMNISGDVFLRKDTVDFHFDTSEVQLFNEYWHFEPNNTIEIVGREIFFNNIKLENETQRIKLDGVLSPDVTKKAHLLVDNFDLGLIARLNEKIPIDGRLFMKSDVFDVYNQLKLSSRTVVRDLKYDGEPIGTLAGDLHWVDEKEEMSVWVKQLIEGEPLLKITGSVFHPFQEDDTLDLKIELSDYATSNIEPFIQQSVSELAGSIHGEATVKGSLEAPVLGGELFLDSIGCHINYLGTDYTIEDTKLKLKERELLFKEVVIRDRLKSKTRLNGKLMYADKQFWSDLNFDFDDFNIFDKEESPEGGDVFYGDIFGSGDLSIKGPFNNLIIKSDKLTSESKTKIYIPLDYSETIEDKSYIRFVSNTDTLPVDLTRRDIDLSGVKLDLNLAIGNQTYSEIIFDKQTGDIIKSYGSGDLKIELDTRGDFNMFGNYIIDRGTYNFTLAGIVNKEFLIEPNSTISWSGDPYQGALDIRATYLQNTSLTPILDSALVDLSASEVRRKYPVSVKMHITEELLSPDLKFDIEFKDYPTTVSGKGNTVVSLEDMINEFNNSVQSNEQELNKQVFSLIILKRLAYTNSLGNPEGGAAASNVSEFLGNYLSNVLSQVDENLEIDLDLADLNSTTQDEVRLRLSYSLFQGRFRVTRSGSFSNGDNGINEDGTVNSAANNLVGDWTVEYAITPEGKFRVKAFNKALNTFTNATQNNASNMTYGASVLYTQNFNSLKDIFKRKKPKKKIDNKELIMKN